MNPAPWRSSWRAARFIVVDLETTGLDPRRNEVISFAAVPVERGRIIAGAAVAGLVRPAAPPPPRSIEIHGLRAQDLTAAPPPPRALAPLVREMRRRILVSHVAEVERAFLRPYRGALTRRLPRPTVDTALLWRLLSIERGEGDPGSRSLADLAASLGHPSTARTRPRVTPSPPPRRSWRWPPTSRRTGTGGWPRSPAPAGGCGPGGWCTSGMRGCRPLGSLEKSSRQATNLRLYA